MDSTHFPDGLFRKELAQPTRSWLPTVVVRSPRAGWLTLGVGLACMAGLGVLLLLGSHTRYRIAQGAIVSASDAKPVGSAIPGIVRDVFVEVGQRVERGTLVAIVDADVRGATGANAASRRGEELAASLAIETGRIRAIREHAGQREDLLRSQLADLNMLSTALALELRNQEQRVANARRIYDASAAAERERLISRIQLYAQKDSLLAAENQAIVQRRMVLEAREQTKALRGQLEALQADTEREIGDQQVRIAEMKMRLADVRSASTRRILSPSSGWVSDLLAQPDAPVKEGQVLAVITSEAGPPPRIEAFALPELLRNVRVGQQVAFKFRKPRSRDMTARIVSFSAPLYDKEGNLSPGRSANRKYSRVILSCEGFGGDSLSVPDVGLPVDILFPVGSSKLYELAFD